MRRWPSFVDGLLNIRSSLRLLLIPGVLLAFGACKPFPTRPAERRPTISSVVAFPTVIGVVGDSALVTVFASDPDGDTLVYDWMTDSRLQIKGAVDDDRSVYGHLSNSQVFYRSAWPAPDSTAWVLCSVRDRRGGLDARLVQFQLGH